MNREDFFELENEEDRAILMHRDAHFGGNFPIMLEYYEKGGKGALPEFELERMQELARIEEEKKQDLATALFSATDTEKVALARKAYKSLRDLYKTEKKAKNALGHLIADLILSEEEDPQQEIAAIVEKKGEIVPLLINIVRSEEFHDPLFPGYGHAPALATRCLGLIGDKRAIISLFESIGETDFFDEDYILEALKKIGQPAKEFLLKVLSGRPLNVDNEKAALALIAFQDDPEAAKACLKMLLEPDVWKDVPLSTYLVLACEGLSDEKDREVFLALAENPHYKALKQDIHAILKKWKSS